MSQGHTRKDAVHQEGRFARHPPSGAARADASVFAGERDGDVMVARFAVDDGEASRKISARQVAPKLVLDVSRQRSRVRLACMLQEVLEVLLHQRVENGLLWLAGQIRRREAGHVPAIALRMPSTSPRILSPFPASSWPGPDRVWPLPGAPLACRARGRARPPRGGSIPDRDSDFGAGLGRCAERVCRSVVVMLKSRAAATGDGRKTWSRAPDLRG
jgi:hypothetical protein